MPQVTLTNPDGSVFFSGAMEVHEDAKPADFPATASADLPYGGTALILKALFTSITIVNVPQARELVISVAGGDTEYFVTVKDPAGNVCERVPAIVPGGTVPVGPAENVRFLNGGQVEVVISTPGTYVAEVQVNKLTGQETVEAHVN